MKKKLTKVQITRRYYLHRRLKGVLEIDPKAKTIKVTDQLISQLSPSALHYFTELKHIFDYSAQFYIPSEDKHPNTLKPLVDEKI